MNRIAALLILALSLPLAARADEASHRAKAEEMMRLLNNEKTVRQVSDNYINQVNSVADRVAGADPSPETKAKVDDFKKQAAQVVEDQLGWKVLQAQLVEIYIKTFTEDEMDSIIAFYKSPTGTTLLAKMPEVNSQIGQFGQSHVKALQPQLQQLFADFQKKLTPPKPTLGPVSPDAPPVVVHAAPAQPSAPATSAPSQPK